MSKIKTRFSDFINENLSNKEYIIGKKDVNILYQLEENDLWPNDSYSEEDYTRFSNDVMGKTVWEYCNWRYPDNPEGQYNAVLNILKNDKKFENFTRVDYKSNNGILIIDDINNEPIAFVVEPKDIEKQLYEISNLFSDDVELDIPSEINVFTSDVIINGRDLYNEMDIKLRLKNIPMY